MGKHRAVAMMLVYKSNSEMARTLRGPRRLQRTRAHLSHVHGRQWPHGHGI